MSRCKRRLNVRHSFCHFMCSSVALELICSSFLCLGRFSLCFFPWSTNGNLNGEYQSHDDCSRAQRKVHKNHPIALTAWQTYDNWNAECWVLSSIKAHSLAKFTLISHIVCGLCSLICTLLHGSCADLCHLSGAIVVLSVIRRYENVISIFSI